MSTAKRIVIGVGTLLCIALTLYYILVIKTGIPCLFHELTGWYCPGCGTCRAVRAFVHGEFREMFSDVLRALRGISDEWQLIVDQYMMPKCELLGYCPEKRGCGRKPKKESN